MAFPASRYRKLRRRDELIDRLWRLAAVVDQMNLVFADLFQTEVIGARHVESGQPRDMVQVVPCVSDVTLRSCMSSCMRLRSGVICDSSCGVGLVIWGNNLIQCASGATRQASVEDKYRVAV